MIGQRFCPCHAADSIACLPACLQFTNRRMSAFGGQQERERKAIRGRMIDTQERATNATHTGLVSRVCVGVCVGRRRSCPVVQCRDVPAIHSRNNKESGLSGVGGLPVRCQTVQPRCLVLFVYCLVRPTVTLCPPFFIQFVTFHIILSTIIAPPCTFKILWALFPGIGMGPSETRNVECHTEHPSSL